MECELIDFGRHDWPALASDTPRILVESGLLLLERSVSRERIASLQEQREHRLQLLADSGLFF